MTKKIQLDVLVAHDEATTPEKLVPGSIGPVRVVKRALDARRRHGRPMWRLTLEAEVEGRIPKDARPIPEALPRLLKNKAVGATTVAIVGAGPAGLFAAWRLSECGVPVTLIERGKPVETRALDCGRFRGKGELNPESNLCFGEGGAGTYSDGKLTTRTRDPLVREVFERLVEVGAPSRILIDAKPHIGTNLLFGVLKNLRRALIDLGVNIHFETRVERLSLNKGAIEGVVHDKGNVVAPRVVLAIGHSARDTFSVLLEQGIPIEPKPFAVGVRAEHPQAMIDACQYRHGPRPETLPAAEYRLAHEHQGRGVYSFCMCPGGMVVPTSTEPNQLVVNGMSTARRGKPHANSGLVVQVELTDLGKLHPLVGVEFQRSLEAAAFTAGGGGYRAPAMLASDFVAKKASGQLGYSLYRPGLVASDLAEVLPPFVVDALRAGLSRFDRQIHGYASSDAILIGTETRTSSPIRIPRDRTTLSVDGFKGLYVAGEGPGYAGGIVSAAVDGLRVAEAILAEIAA